MGYVRLIRSGGNRCLSQGTCFIPDLAEVELLNELTANKMFRNASSSSVEFVLKDLNGFTEHFENTTEYFKLLVAAFLSHFRNPSNTHLKNFYIIVPPLTINFVEHSLTCKEKLFKKDKTDSAFTDDGFALGKKHFLRYACYFIENFLRLSIHNRVIKSGKSIQLFALVRFCSA